MHDLNANMFFKAKFTIRSNAEGDNDLLWNLVLKIRKWLIEKYNRHEKTVVTENYGKWTAFKNGGKLFDEENKNRVFAESVYHCSSDDHDMISWACRISEHGKRKEEYAPRDWVTEIGFQSSEAGSAEISYVVTYSDLPGFIGFCEDVPSLNVPNIVKWIFEDRALQCYIGKTQISMSPHRLNVGDFPTFKEYLFDPERVVPVLYISPKITKNMADETETSELLIRPYKLASSVAGNADVYYSVDPGFTSEMNYMMDDDRYLCMGGAVRLYRPKIDVHDLNDSYRHRFLPANFIEEYGENTVLNIYRRALAQDVAYYEGLFRLDKCRELVDRDRQQERYRLLRESMLHSQKEKVEEVLEDAIRLQDEKDAIEHEKADLVEEVSQLKGTKYELERRNEHLEMRAAQAGELERALRSVREVGTYPQTPREVAEYFSRVFEDRIAFTERAYKSLEDCSLKTELLWEVLFHMATTLLDLHRQQQLPVDKEFKRITGWDYARGEGKMTRNDNRLMRQYEDVYKGKAIHIEAHIKRGSKETDPKFVRIYYAYDPSVADKIIIGQCGKHMETYGTRRM